MKKKQAMPLEKSESLLDLKKTPSKVVCCKKLQQTTLDSEFDMKYFEDMRSFSFASCRGNYCPFCGTMTPLELTEFYDQVLLKEFGINLAAMDYHEKEKIVLPKEFQSDEWWLKRQHLPNFPQHDLTQIQLVI